MTICTICTYGCDGVVDVSALPCGHIFHRDCLEAWLAIQLSCPFCRQVFTSTDYITKLYLYPTDIPANLEETLALKDEKIRSLETDVRTKEECVVQVKEQAKEREAFVLSYYNNFTEDLKTELTAKDHEIMQLHGRLAILEYENNEKLAKKDEELDVKQELVEKFLERANDDEYELNELKAQLKAKDGEITRLLSLQDALSKEELEKKDALISRFERQANAHDYTISALKTKLEELEEELKDKDERIKKFAGLQSIPTKVEERVVPIPKTKLEKQEERGNRYGPLVVSFHTRVKKGKIAGTKTAKSQELALQDFQTKVDKGPKGVQATQLEEQQTEVQRSKCHQAMAFQGLFRDFQTKFKTDLQGYQTVKLQECRALQDFSIMKLQGLDGKVRKRRRAELNSKGNRIMKLQSLQNIPSTACVAKKKAHKNPEKKTERLANGYGSFILSLHVTVKKGRRAKWKTKDNHIVKVKECLAIQNNPATTQELLARQDSQTWDRQERLALRDYPNKARNGRITEMKSKGGLTVNLQESLALQDNQNKEKKGRLQK